MDSRLKTCLVILNVCLFLSTVVGTSVVATSAVAQERRSDRDDDDRDGSDDRRERWRSRWRDRSDDDDDREDRGSDERSSDRESSEPRSDESPSISTEVWAKALVKQNDKNGNMMLDGDERQALRGRSAVADFNKDNVITVEELVAASGPSTTAASAPTTQPAVASSSELSSRSSSRDRSGDESKSGGAKRVYTGSVGVGKVDKDGKSSRRTYRFSVAGERLPTGLPSWFKSRDKNGDGQVLMSEYSRSWSSRLVAEFRRYDANDDGVITAKEVARK
jgi:hypothetical protein